jgi:hypothetical protein
MRKGESAPSDLVRQLLHQVSERHTSDGSSETLVE